MLNRIPNSTRASSKRFNNFWIKSLVERLPGQCPLRFLFSKNRCVLLGGGQKAKVKHRPCASLLREGWLYHRFNRNQSKIYNFFPFRFHRWAGSLECQAATPLFWSRPEPCSHSFSRLVSQRSDGHMRCIKFLGCDLNTSIGANQKLVFRLNHFERMLRALRCHRQRLRRADHLSILSQIVRHLSTLDGQSFCI